MDIKLLLSYLSTFGIQLLQEQLVAAIKIKVLANPSISDTDLVSTEDGTLKHSVRGKIGFFVDFLWPDIEPTLDRVILAAAAEAHAEIAGVA